MFQGLMNEIKEQIPLLSESLKKKEEYGRKVMEKNARIREEIKVKFDMIRAAIDERERELLEEVNRMECVWKEPWMLSKDDLATNLRNAKDAIEFADNALKSSEVYKLSIKEPHDSYSYLETLKKNISSSQEVQFVSFCFM